MIKPILVLFILCSIVIVSCNSGQDSGEEQKGKDLPTWVHEMWDAHGELNDYMFDFRGATYTFSHKDQGFRYTKQFYTDSTNQFDELTNEGFVRILNNDTLKLEKDKADAYAESLNSVIYFVCLPQKLKDNAVNMKELQDIKIDGSHYHVLKVFFDEENGGSDYDDEFIYWVNTDTKFVDFFAYRYHVNGGGVRFRKAMNRINVDGMIFQDYINYEASFETDLTELPMKYEKGELKELSRIILENIILLN